MDWSQTAEHIARRLTELSGFTATPGEGCTRLPFTRETREAADYLKAEMAADGLETWEDGAGNVFGRLPGRDSALPCIMCGSHYDSVVCGGNYDGIAGVVCAMELARLLKECGPLDRDFVVAAFMDEEGCRFGSGCFGSRAIMGRITPEYCHSVRDKRDGSTVAQRMKEYGLDPERVAEAAWAPGTIGNYLELHIEQGPVLDAKGIQLGLVDCIVGIQRYMVTIHGQSNHAGTTPMDMRLDAMDRAARVIVRAGEIARTKGRGCVATVGYVEAFPGSYNVVPGKAVFSAEMRATEQELVDQMAAEIRQALEEETADGLTFEMEQKANTPPVHLSRRMTEISEGICRDRGFTYRIMPSGAGHDAQIIGQGVEASMLFVPSRQGLSHCPQEHSEYTDLLRAVQVALELIRKL